MVSGSFEVPAVLLTLLLQQIFIGNRVHMCEPSIMQSGKLSC